MTETTKKEKWYLQIENNKFGEAYAPYHFWDTYLHHDCSLICESDKNPFSDGNNGQ